MKKLLTILILVPMILYITACSRDNTNPHTGYISEQCGGWWNGVDKQGKTIYAFCSTYIHTWEYGDNRYITLEKIIIEQPQVHNHYIYYKRG